MSLLAITSAKSPFLFLALELPPPPLFHDELEKNIIPQVPLATILSKYDGKTIQVSPILALVVIFEVIWISHTLVVLPLAKNLHEFAEKNNRKALQI
jgi:U4/U6.U5 tri-snRNP-associated protein 2